MFTRKVIYCSDVAQIFGITKRAAQYRMRRVKEYFNKTSDQPIFVDEFCNYFSCRKELLDNHFKAIGEPEYPKKPDKNANNGGHEPKPKT
jgi:hypothetical protein